MKDINKDISFNLDLQFLLKTFLSYIYMYILILILFEFSSSFMTGWGDPDGQRWC